MLGSKENGAEVTRRYAQDHGMDRLGLSSLTLDVATDHAVLTRRAAQVEVLSLFSTRITHTQGAHVPTPPRCGRQNVCAGTSSHLYPSFL